MTDYRYEIIPVGVSPTLSVDELKYQETKVVKGRRQVQKNSAPSNCATAARQRKEPTDRLPGAGQRHGLDKSSDNFRYRRRSRIRYLLPAILSSKATPPTPTLLNSAAPRQKDPNGYRRRLIDMIDTMKSLADPEVAGRDNC